MRVSYNSSIGVFQTSGTGAAPVIRSKRRLGGTSTRSRTSENRAGESTSTQEGKPELYGDKMKV